MMLVATMRSAVWIRCVGITIRSPRNETANLRVEDCLAKTWIEEEDWGGPWLARKGLWGDKVPLRARSRFESSHWSMYGNVKSALSTSNFFDFYNSVQGSPFL